MTTLYFVRHGTYENPKGINPFRLPGFPLANEGVKQAEEDGKYFLDKNIAAIYTSPILRTRQTAKIIGTKINLKPRITDLLIEVRTPFQGYDKEYISKVIKNIYQNKLHREKKGESIKDIQNRVRQFIEKVLGTSKDKNIIVVSHGDPIMFYLMKEVGNKITGGDNELHWKNFTYIPMGGILKAQYRKNKLQSLQQVNY